MRPLDPLSSIKIKLGVVIVAAVGVTVAVVALGSHLGLPPILAAAVAIVLALAMVQLLAHGMTSPLREMVAATAAMTRGDYERRVTATSRDEVGELARAFNAMASDLAEVDRMRRDLIANVSHELRTPISALQAVLENMVDGVELPEPPKLRLMLRQVERLGRLVSQLLDLSRLESGAVPLQKRRFDLKAVIDQAVGESQLQTSSVKLAVRVQPDGLEADGDPERVHQVMSNLIDNAVRHSPDGSEVLISARADDAAVSIEVADQGPGIPAEEVPRVFERFYRLDAARSSSEGGTGLGLAIARWIVDLHGGSIRAETSEAGGCRMVVSLPRT